MEVEEEEEEEEPDRRGIRGRSIRSWASSGGTIAVAVAAAAAVAGGTSHAGRIGPPAAVAIATTCSGEERWAMAAT